MTEVGIVSGLRLTFNIQQDDYVKEVGDTAGIMVTVTAQNQIGVPEELGFTVPPGQYTSVGMQPVAFNLIFVLLPLRSRN